MKKVVVALVLIMSSTAYGMVYTWTDSRGDKHYTNKEHEIPMRYRVKVKSLYPDQIGISLPQQQPATLPPPQPLPQAPQQAKPPDEQQKTEQPSLAPEPQKSAPQQPVKRNIRSRSSRSVDIE